MLLELIHRHACHFLDPAALVIIIKAIVLLVLLVLVLVVVLLVVVLVVVVLVVVLLGKPHGERHKVFLLLHPTRVGDEPIGAHHPRFFHTRVFLQEKTVSRRLCDRVLTRLRAPDKPQHTTTIPTSTTVTSTTSSSSTFVLFSKGRQLEPIRLYQRLDIRLVCLRENFLHEVARAFNRRPILDINHRPQEEPTNVLRGFSDRKVEPHEASTPVRFVDLTLPMKVPGTACISLQVVSMCKLVGVRVAI
mmetsp:Transcript_3156/g.6141  ORF Transcript_3156/g.6141 Transcript_3156/m.6141 type:complete len:247 (+) Transcript_3156:299-1039(+)